jgi:hypothetical protein
MSAENSIDLTVQIRFGELYSANLKFALRRGRFILFGGIFLFVVTATIMLHASLLDPPDDHWTLFAQNIRPLFYVTLIVFLMPVTTLINTAKAFRDPRRRGGFKYHVTNAGIHVEGSTGSSDYNWTAFLEAREVSAAFFLFVTPFTFHVILKRCFNSNEDVDQFREIIRTNIPKSNLR